MEITHLNSILPCISAACDPTALDAKHWGQNTGHEGQPPEVITHTFLQNLGHWWACIHINKHIIIAEMNAPKMYIMHLNNTHTNVF